MNRNCTLKTAFCITKVPLHTVDEQTVDVLRNLNSEIAAESARANQRANQRGSGGTLQHHPPPSFLENAVPALWTVAVPTIRRMLALG